jgi:hypothetical protein
MNVLWVDPGETFGWAKSSVVDGKLHILDYGNEAAQPFLMKLAGYARMLDLIGFETYTIRADKFEANVGGDVPTLQFIGGIRLIGWLAQRDRADGFPRIEDALAGVHDDGHYGDALLHTMAWYKTEILDGRPLEAL